MLYFYSPQVIDVKLRVDFRGGLITQCFPYASGGSSPFVPIMEKDAHGQPEWRGRFDPIGFQDPTSNNDITWKAHVHHPDDYVEPSASQQAHSRQAGYLHVRLNRTFSVFLLKA